MKVLWITNTIFPAVCEELGLPVPVVGGWMYSSAKYLVETFGEIELGVASLYGGKHERKLEIGGMTYFLIPQKEKSHIYDKELEGYWKNVKAIFQPDVVHIHGTEYPHGLAYINACGNAKVIVSIQGLVSIYERNYFGGISGKDLKKYITLRDTIRNDSIFVQRKRMAKRAEYEKLLIKGVNHVIGRTSWDKTHAWVINPDVNYHFCNETLREEFYMQNWHYDNCEKHSIFLSQAHYPIKGLHQVIKALPLILRKYPDAKVYVAGNNFFSGKKRWKLNGFGSYVNALLTKYKIQQNIIFVGTLSETKMCEMYQKANVFVCPSSIENSPNSVGEAQLVGVPCVVSHVGGAPEMVIHEKSGLVYRFEEYEMLAMNVIRIFDSKDLAERLSEEGKKSAFIRHSKNENILRLNTIYREICNV